MNIFVTVGTFKFDSLIKKVDSLAEYTGFNIVCQIGEGLYLPKHCKYFRFKNSISEFVEKADIIITHAGAGTVYSLL